MCPWRPALVPEGESDSAGTSSTHEREPSPRTNRENIESGTGVSGLRAGRVPLRKAPGAFLDPAGSSAENAQFTPITAGASRRRPTNRNPAAASRWGNMQTPVPPPPAGMQKVKRKMAPTKKTAEKIRLTRAVSNPR